MAGLDDLHREKTEFDRHLLNQSFDAISYYVLELDHAPQIVCSVGFTPEVDFKGNLLQSLEFPETHADMCTCSIISTQRGGAIVFAWLKESNGACTRLVESLDGLKPYLIPSAIVRLVFEHGENVFFSHSWWNSLDQKTQMMLEERANSLESRPPNTLIDDGSRPVLWSIVSKSMSWPYKLSNEERK